MRMSLSLLSVLTGCLALTSLTACGSDDATTKGTIRVLAASSLTESFTELAKMFDKDHPDTLVELNFGPSSGLAEQIDSGAPADVFASASPATMDTVVEAGHAEGPEDFARNSMVIAVPADNPGTIAALADLAGSEVKVAVCQAQVPCGMVTAEVFSNAELTVEPITEETDVKAVLTKVSLGEVDAGIVYVTDVRAAGDDVRGIEIPEEQNASTTYPIATLTHSENAVLAEEFLDLVLSGVGAKVLGAAGFKSP